MDADFAQEVYVPLLDATRASRGKIYHRAPDLFAMRFTDPQGDVIVADGRYVWMYHPSTDPRQVMRSRLTEGGQQIDLQREFLSNATDRYDATRTGSESVAGRVTHAMAKNSTFDITSTVDLQEVDNASTRRARRSQQRYDFKGATAEIDFDKKEGTLTLLADDDYR
jgi:outer membrane lipoprotein-sorting protein